MVFNVIRAIGRLSYCTFLVVMADSASVRRNIVKTFKADTFVPKSGPFGLYKNKHWQTIVGSEALQMKFRGPYPRLATFISKLEISCNR